MWSKHGSKITQLPAVLKNFSYNYCVRQRGEPRKQKKMQLHPPEASIGGPAGDLSILLLMMSGWPFIPAAARQSYHFAATSSFVPIPGVYFTSAKYIIICIIIRHIHDTFHSLLFKLVSGLSSEKVSNLWSRGNTFSSPLLALKLY